ncbi:MAG: type II toxin-antitoxin system VapB family antitoxin [Hyphomonadaceae bacterium]|nr:type II toxin-antitoxin system VapB family antitoxin [Hyphomonadaceae bacterium]
MRTTVEIDDRVMEALRTETGLKTKKETVDCALRFLLDQLHHGDVVVSPRTHQAGRIISLCEEDAHALRHAMETPQTDAMSARLVAWG